MSFSRLDFGPGARLPVWFVPLLLLALGLLAWGGLRYAELQRAKAEKAQRLHGQQRLRAEQKPAPSSPLPAKERVAAVNEAIDTLNMPWPTLLGTIESVRGAEIVLTHLEPRPKDRLVLITAQSEGMDALVSFMQTLARTAPFEQAAPLRQELVMTPAGLRSQASFELRWSVMP
ncbi:hypothetical protein [Paucibacter sp. XJ19-41]|uniref:hypothetical protein n=1 Tax=Paucibacter sp. XJ19-41 TaxID=2927824 RepID=UPI00234940DE|nr:hypothetical protein [Paucibacter sp. XJ19-41]MDC6167888.1 hypothetical protein [Paucibacter sp. XJ19-41]